MSWQALLVLGFMLVALSGLVGGVGLYLHEGVPQALSLALAVLAALAFTLSAVAAWPA